MTIFGQFLANFWPILANFGPISSRLLDQIWENSWDIFVGEFWPNFGPIMGKRLGRFWSDFDDDVGDEFVLV
jgi:hypothetical protein